MKTFINIQLSLLLCLAIFCTHCTSKQLLEKVSQVTITAYGTDKQNKEIRNTKKLTDIHQITSFVSSKKAPMYKCGYQGKITFYTSKGIIAGEYNYSSGCAHISFLVDGEIVSRKLTPQGATYLKSLTEKAKVTESIIFQYYGEPTPYDGNINKKAAKYGFSTKRVARCLLTDDLGTGIK